MYYFCKNKKIMKTIKRIDGTFERATNDFAENEVRFGRATFAPKSEWKKNTRENRSIEVKIAEVKGSATKEEKRQKRQKLKEKQR
jgi:hypothetical protein